MSTIKCTTLQNLSGVEVYTAKAWVNFNGTGTVAIRASGNVSSITDNGVGDYTMNFTTAMVDANYALSSSIGGLTSGGNSSNSVAMIADYLTVPAVGSCRILSSIAATGTLTDHQRICFSILR